MAGEERLNRLLQALSHPARRCVVRVLGERGRASYAELMRECGVQDSSVLAFHLRRLRGLVEKGEDGYYRLTGEGREAFEVLRRLLDLGGSPGEGGGGVGEIVYSDRVSFRLTREHLERAKRKGARILLADIAHLVIDPVSVELFDEVVEGIMDVGVIHAPKSLRTVIDEKMVDVVRVEYYDESEGPPGEEEDIPAVADTIASVIGPLVTAVLTGIASAITGSLRGLKRGAKKKVRLETGPVAKLVVSGCGVRVERGGKPLVEAVNAEIEEGGERLVLRGAGGCKARVSLPRVERLAVRLRGAALTGGLEARELRLDAVGSAVNLSVSLWGDASLEARLVGSAAKLGIDACRASRLDAILEARGASIDARISRREGVPVSVVKKGQAIRVSETACRAEATQP